MSETGMEIVEATTEVIMYPDERLEPFMVRTFKLPCLRLPSGILTSIKPGDVVLVTDFDDPELVYTQVIAAASVSALHAHFLKGAVRVNGAWCDSCAGLVRIDEGGCCVTCGADATPMVALLVPLPDTEKPIHD